MKRYYKYILSGSEARFERALRNQVQDADDLEYGAVYETYVRPDRV